jgi:hypothetical protein
MLASLLDHLPGWIIEAVSPGSIGYLVSGAIDADRHEEGRK